MENKIGQAMYDLFEFGLILIKQHEQETINEIISKIHVPYQTRTFQDYTVIELINDGGADN